MYKIALFNRFPQHSKPTRQDEREREIDWLVGLCGIQEVYDRTTEWKALYFGLKRTWVWILASQLPALWTLRKTKQNKMHLSSFSLLSRIEVVTRFCEDQMPGQLVLCASWMLVLIMTAFCKQIWCATARFEFWCLKIALKCAFSYWCFKRAHLGFLVI